MAAEKAYELYYRLKHKPEPPLAALIIVGVILHYTPPDRVSTLIESQGALSGLLTALFIAFTGMLLTLLYYLLILFLAWKIMRKTRKRRFNPYKVLGVPENATTWEIEDAYQRLYQKYSPKQNPKYRVLDRLKEIDKAHKMLTKKYSEEPKVDIVRMRGSD